ncbi:MAG: hypothetical protein WAZ50_01525, partial [Minisyncoccia bacterium]
MADVIRPVASEPPIQAQAFINPKTGCLTNYGLMQIRALHLRTGGFTDEIAALLGFTSLSQVSALAAAGATERTLRTLGDGLQQVQGQQTERLRAAFEAYKRETDAKMGQLIGGLSRPPQTRIVEFTADDTWRPRPDLRALQVIALGAGGGGGSGFAQTAGPGAGGYGGGGGGGGGLSFYFLEPASLPDSVTVTVGLGGAGGASRDSGVSDPYDGENGSFGGNTSFGTIVFAAGGSGGAGG